MREDYGRDGKWGFSGILASPFTIGSGSQFKTGAEDLAHDLQQMRCSGARY